MKERMVEMCITCRVCGETKIVPVKEKDYLTYMSPKRPYIQDIFPYLTPAERELIISQTCAECWDNMFKEDEDDAQ